MEDRNKAEYEKIRRIKTIAFAVQCLEKGIMICTGQNKPVRPIHCANEELCKDKFCPSKKYVDTICKQYEVDRYEIWKNRRSYRDKTSETG